jgi:Tfp pilus assembly protein PilF
MLWFSASCFLGTLGISVSLAALGHADFRPAAGAQWELGKRYLSEGNAEEAKKAFENLLDQYPRDPNLHLFLGITSLRLRDPRAAETHLRRAVSLAPDHADARTLLGWILLEVRRDYDGAVEQYTEVVALRPGSAKGYNNLGVALKRKGAQEEALKNFSRALIIEDSYSEAWSNRGWVYLEQNRWREARQDFERALEIDPNDEGALHGLSRVLKQFRDYPGAQRVLNKLIAQSPNFVYWLEWGQLQLVRYYWMLLLVAGVFFIRAQYKRRRRKIDGRSSEEA